MSLPDIDLDNFVAELLKHKEIYSLKLGPRTLQQTEIDELISKSNKLQFRRQQIFVRYFMGPHTPFKRMILKHKTGTGKTLTSLGLSLEFIKKFQVMYDMGEPFVGNVILMGFNIKAIFYRELLRFPELGYITKGEVKQYNDLKKSATKGTKEDIDRLREFRAMIVRRFYKKRMGGFFHIFGYKEFVNHLFIPDEDIQLTNLSNEEIRTYLEEGKLQINQTIVEIFKNSILICDEIHNVYNSLEKNNYGVALQTILDKLPCLKAVFMSATLLNNSPTEYIDMQNLLLRPKEQIKESDIFDKEGQLLKGAENKIAKLMTGRISFFRDEDPSHFPVMTFEGEDISIPASSEYKDVRKEHKKIPFLPFIRCPMSPLHYKTYKAHYQGALSIDDHTLDDMVFPRPPEPGKAGTVLGLFNTSETKKLLRDAPQKWKDKMQVSTYEDQGMQITGEFLQEENIGIYSTKFAKMLHVLKGIIGNKKEGGKILIYHPYVSMSGVMLIREICRKNGIIDLDSEITDQTRCVTCGVIHKKHKSNVGHDFIPVRMTIAHGSIDKNLLVKEREMANSPENVEGNNIYMLIGSSAIREGFNLMAFRHLLVMSRDNNISQLIQLLGRPNRFDSHVQLPPQKQTLKVRIFVSSMPAGVNSRELSHEEDRYLWKLLDYSIIQKIERVFNSIAVDANLYRDIVAVGLETNPKKMSLKPLFFKPIPDLTNAKPMRLQDLKTSTFYAFHVNDEITTIKYIIKRLFIEKSSVWKYGDLWRTVQEPPFYVQYNASIFDENNFIAALTELIWNYKTYNISTGNEDITDSLVDKLFSQEKDIITKNGQRSAIVQVGEYYMIFPLVHTKGLKESSIEPGIDVESCYRDSREIPARRIGIKKFISQSDTLFDYNKQKISYHSRYNNIDISRLSMAICEYTPNFHIKFLEDSIQYVFKIWTNPYDVEISEFHDFYFKMVQFYTSLELVIYAAAVQDIPLAVEEYKSYASGFTKITSSKKDNPETPETSDTTKSKNKTESKISKLAKTSMLALLESSISRSGMVDQACADDPLLDEQKLKATIARSREHYNRTKKSKIIIPADPETLPVGHILDDVPKLFSPDKGWFNIAEYSERLGTTQYKENTHIIGYYEKSKTGMAVKFKLRKPIQNITMHRDTRLIEKGSVCTSSKKHELVSIMKKLGIKTPCQGIKDVCNLIRVKLIENEIRERRKGTNIKWFYHLIEKQPLQM